MVLSFVPFRAALVDVGGVEAGGRRDAGVHRGAEGEMAADADSHDAELAGGGGVGSEEIEQRRGVVSRSFSSGFVVFSWLPRSAPAAVVGERAPAASYSW